MWSTSVEVCGCVAVLLVLVTRLVLRGGRRGALPALQSAGTLRVLVINEQSTLGKEVCAWLRAAGCVVNSVQRTSVDALVVAGGTREEPGLHSLVDLVTADLNNTIKEVEESARRVRVGGRIVWVATSAAVRDSFSGTVDAFDRVMRLQIEHIAHSAQCEAVWLGRRCEAGRAVHSALSAPAHSWNVVRGVRGEVRGWWKLST